MDILVANVGAFMELWMIQIYFGLVWKERIVFRKFSFFLFLWNVAVVTLANVGIVPGFVVWTSYLWLWWYLFKLRSDLTVKSKIFRIVVSLVAIWVTEIISATFISCFYSVFDESSGFVFLNVISVVIAYLFSLAYFKTNQKHKINIEGNDSYVVIFFSVIIWLAILIYYYFNHSLKLPYNIMIVGILILLFIYVFRLQKKNHEINQKNLELAITRSYDAAYKELLKDLRRKQHNYKNQLAAISNSIYQVDSLEQLTDLKKTYFEHLNKDGKFDSLLLGSNCAVISGFLFCKFEQCDEMDIDVDYKVKIDEFNTDIYLYEVIEIFGVLIDNAVENEIKSSYQHKKIKLNFVEYNDYIELEVLNRYKKISSDDIEKMFETGFSTKGKDRGLGLSRVKKILSNYKTDICVKNIEKDVNWISFSIKFRKDKPS